MRAAAGPGHGAEALLHLRIPLACSNAQLRPGFKHAHPGDLQGQIPLTRIFNKPVQYRIAEHAPPGADFRWLSLRLLIMNSLPCFRQRRLRRPKVGADLYAPCGAQGRGQKDCAACLPPRICMCSHCLRVSSRA